MLLSLQIQDLAVIERADIEFAPGLNILSGETGSGKSIVVDALGFLLGNRADAGAVRASSERAVITGVFALSKSATTAIHALLQNAGLDGDCDQLILRREIAAGGKSKAWINDQPATVSLLRQAAAELAEIHSQNQVLVSFGPASRLAALDIFAARCDSGFDAQLAATANAHSEWRRWQSRLQELEGAGQRRLQEADLWRFQREELRAAQLRLDDDSGVEQEHRVLAHAAKIAALSEEAHQLLYDSPEAATSSLKAAVRKLQEIARIDTAAKPLISRLEGVRSEIEDIADALRDRSDHLDASPERLAWLEDRLALLDRLKRKYGPSLEDVVNYAAEVERKLDEFERSEIYVAEARTQLAAAAETYLSVATQLSNARSKAAASLAKSVVRHSADLAMKAHFAIEVAHSDDRRDWTELGCDRVAFMVATNPGEPLRPIEQIASGGELSRVLLALDVAIESAGAGKRRQSAMARTLVFDEIDSGIGGRAAEAVGEKLKQLAENQQILCVTHLAQIARFADHHLRVEKQVRGNRAVTAVGTLWGNDRVEEIARMLAGNEVNSAARKHAQELLRAQP